MTGFLLCAAATSGDLTPQGAAGQRLGHDIVDLYEQAVAATEKTCDDYRRIKAMRLAMQRDIAFDAAYELIQPVMPELEPVAKELLRRKIIDPADLKAHEAEVNKIKKQIEDMIELTTKLLLEIEVLQAQSNGADIKYTTRLEEIVQREEFNPQKTQSQNQSGETAQQAQVGPESTKNQNEIDKKEMSQMQVAELRKLAEAAVQDDNQRAKDLTPFMRRPASDIRDLTREDQKKYSTREIKLFEDHALPAGKAGFAIAPRDIILARNLRDEGEKGVWMFLDTWYTIGPFPNPSRINIHRKFPPETVVDLDATYIGKNDRQIRWKFRQSRDPKVIPADAEEYGIWYAYTEVYMDRPCDLWVAIGSDDKGNVWLNDQPIWISNDQLKPWRIDEGFRKVHFQAGRNRILFRVENGWYAMAFSFGIRIAKPEK